LGGHAALTRILGLAAVCHLIERPDARFDVFGVARLDFAALGAKKKIF
jgi:hypothetical protein